MKDPKKVFFIGMVAVISDGSAIASVRPGQDVDSHVMTSSSDTEGPENTENAESSVLSADEIFQSMLRHGGGEDHYEEGPSGGAGDVGKGDRDGDDGK